jgi:glycosyltransferase involved in cell wall biosynthesis
VRAWQALLGSLLPPQIAIFHDFRPPPYGGSNQFLTALRDELRRRGFRVGANRIARATRAALLNSFAFDEARLRRMRAGAACRIVHRVDGPVGTYRGTDNAIDRRIAALNHELADATVFQSRYCLEAHRALGLEFRAPVVVLNAPDERVFHPRGRAPWDPARKVRLISTSWSDNPNKGAATYKWIEERLDWSAYDYTFVGRAALRFDRIRTLPPQPPERVAQLLREHDVYVAGSLHDPCSNALLEALACGLPAVYANSGGHPEIVGDAGVPFESAEDALEAISRVVAGYEQRQARIRVPVLTEVTDGYLQAMGLPGVARTG